MKKLFAIIMLAAYLFNLTGYNLFFQYSIHQADQRLIRQIDKNHFQDNQLVEVKIKLNLPYMSDWSSYERFDGEIELQGVHYNYVKRKVSQDTLYMLCLPNEVKTALNNDENKFLVNSNDFPSGKGNDNSSLKKIASADEFKQQVILYDFSVTATTGRSDNNSPSFYIPLYYINSPGKPPELNS